MRTSFLANGDHHRMSQRTWHAVVPARYMCKYNDLRKEITAAFWAEGFKGVMRVTSRCRSTAHLLIAKFGLNRQKVERKNKQERTRRYKANLRHLKKVWGWFPGHDSVVLRELRRYIPRRYVKNNGRVRFNGIDTYVEYIVPRGLAREFLIVSGVRWWLAGSRRIPVHSQKGKQKTVTLRLSA